MPNRFDATNDHWIEPEAYLPFAWVDQFLARQALTTRRQNLPWLFEPAQRRTDQHFPASLNERQIAQFATQWHALVRAVSYADPIEPLPEQNDAVHNFLDFLFIAYTMVFMVHCTIAGARDTSRFGRQEAPYFVTLNFRSPP